MLSLWRYIQRRPVLPEHLLWLSTLLESWSPTVHVQQEHDKFRSNAPVGSTLFSRRKLFCHKQSERTERMEDHCSEHMELRQKLILWCFSSVPDIIHKPFYKTWKVNQCSPWLWAELSFLYQLLYVVQLYPSALDTPLQSIKLQNCTLDISSCMFHVYTKVSVYPIWLTSFYFHFVPLSLWNK